MIASGLGFGFMPRSCVTHPGVVARPLVEPEFWREVNLVTVRGRPHAPAVGRCCARRCGRNGSVHRRWRPSASGRGAARVEAGYLGMRHARAFAQRS